MRTQTQRVLGDAFIVGAWLVFVAAFLVIWAPLMVPWTAAAIVLLIAVPTGCLLGQKWARFVMSKDEPSLTTEGGGRSSPTWRFP